eukprot:537961-Alexandrium_andersonii.AAC.1
MLDQDDISDKALKGHFAMTTFGIANNHETSTCEAGHFSCQRLSIVGTRSIVFAKVLDVVAFL